jgi:hypothetical protein
MRRKFITYCVAQSSFSFLKVFIFHIPLYEQSPAVLHCAEIFYYFISKHSSYETNGNNAVAIKFRNPTFRHKLDSLGPSTILPPLYGRGTWNVLSGQDIVWPVQQERTDENTMSLGRGSEKVWTQDRQYMYNVIFWRVRVIFLPLRPPFS